MLECKLVKVPIFVRVKLSIEHTPKTREEIKYMEHVPYVNSIGSMMYVILCT